jgi:hypothetical protein
MKKFEAYEELKMMSRNLIDPTTHISWNLYRDLCKLTSSDLSEKLGHDPKESDIVNNAIMAVDCDDPKPLLDLLGRGLGVTITTDRPRVPRTA